MSDLIRLRKEYDAAVKRRHGKIGATGLEIRADALIAALEAENERVNRLLAEASETLDLLIKGVDS